MSKILKSPIYYVGNKYNLLKQLKDLFPKNINVFYDMFGGSGTVAMNFANCSKKVVYNELNPFVYKMFEYYRNTPANVLNDRIKEISKQAGLPINIATKKSIKEHLESYMKIREEYYENDRKNTLFHIWIMHYSFSNMIGFNEHGFNKGVTSFRQRYYKEQKSVERHIKLNEIDNIELSNKSVFDFNIEHFNENDFIYVDPPYTGSKAPYLKNGEWGINEDLKLIEFLNKLTKRGVKWGLSDVFKNKGHTNQHLIDWVEKEKLYIHKPYVKYTTNGSVKESFETVEVFITNYDTQKYVSQISLFGGEYE